MNIDTLRKASYTSNELYHAVLVNDLPVTADICRQILNAPDVNASILIEALRYGRLCVLAKGHKQYTAGSYVINGITFDTLFLLNLSLCDAVDNNESLSAVYTIACTNFDRLDIETISKLHGWFFTRLSGEDIIKWNSLIERRLRDERGTP